MYTNRPASGLAFALVSYCLGGPKTQSGDGSKTYSEHSETGKNMG